MKRLFSCLVLTLLVVSPSACSSAKPPTQAAVQGNKVIASLKDLSSMYEKKNLPGFMSIIADSYPDRQALASSIQTVFGNYESVQFTIQYPRMFIEVANNGTTRTTFNWNSAWEAKGAVLKNSGRDTFVFESGEGRLISIEGKNPFIPQAIETPGK